ncbi:hypothetical protein [Sinomonas atrocyanea]|uniref:hypothetical protein n=1 Tax=Sinomonas atrocyanea TaxID=37927 RepID=UPI00277F4214|nr:hypothetical protein [Sinomonas atrocyanea]MDQ0259420.1 hypothetical protein [Sinomonas atrocyanea]MDR6621175.1 hypothetical protein [Sinomonas atrocyanea]
MRDHADWRTGALALVRHAAAAAGLGLGWLLLSGGAASAAGLPPDPSVLSPSSGPGIVGALARTTAPLASDPIGTGAGPAAATASSVASQVRAVPQAVEPLTDGPLAPLSPVLAPVVSGTAGTLGSAVDSAGTAAQAVADGTRAVLPAPLAGTPAPVLSAPVISTPVPSAPILSAAVGAQAAETREASGTSSGGQAAGAASAASRPFPQAPAAGRAGSSADAVLRFLVTGPLVPAALMADAARAVLPDVPAPGFPTLPALPTAAGSADGSLVGSGGAGPGAAALAAAGFALALAWRAGPRVRPQAVPLPPLPAFDPGSTPD